MKKFSKVIAVVLGVSLAAGLGLGVKAAPKEADTGMTAAEREIIVVYDDAGVSKKQSEKIQEEAEASLNDMEIEVTGDVAKSAENQGTIVVAEIPEEKDMAEAVEEVLADENVSYVQPNFVYTLFENDSIETMALVNDPEAGKYYQADGNYLEDVNVLRSWDMVKSSKKVTVAVLDTGCRLDHEDLENNILLDYAYDTSGTEGKKLTASNTKNSGDPIGHGTHVSGLVAAEANNGKGIAGTSYNANILPIKIFDEEGNATTASIISAIAYCRDLIVSGKVPNLRVINMSFGYYLEESPNTEASIAEDAALENAIKGIKDTCNVLTVCAGGNGYEDQPIETRQPRTDTVYPSDFDVCLSVTALDEKGADCTWSDYNAAKDISAPGSYVRSADCGETNDYSYRMGTSMAAPIVSGICALLWAEDPQLTVDEVVAAIKDTARPVENSASGVKRDVTGIVNASAGAIDAEAALKAIGAEDDPSGAETENPDESGNPSDSGNSTETPDDGSEADTDIISSDDSMDKDRVIQKDKKDEKNEKDVLLMEDDEQQKHNKQAAKTGDGVNPFSWVGLFLVSGCAVYASVSYRKKVRK